MGSSRKRGWPASHGSVMRPDARIFSAKAAYVSPLKRASHEARDGQGRRDVRRGLVRAEAFVAIGAHGNVEPSAAQRERCSEQQRLNEELAHRIERKHEEKDGAVALQGNLPAGKVTVEGDAHDDGNGDRETCVAE